LAERNNVDLIVIATPRHDRLAQNWPLARLREKVVRLANCPVLVMRIHAEEESGDAVKRDSVGASR